MPLDKTDAPAAEKQRPKRTPTRLLSPEQKRAKRTRWRANKRRREGEQIKAQCISWELKEALYRRQALAARSLRAALTDMPEPGTQQFEKLEQREHAGIAPAAGILAKRMADHLARMGEAIMTDGQEVPVVEELLKPVFEEMLSMGEAVHRQNQRERKRVYRKPRAPKNQLDKALRIL